MAPNLTLQKPVVPVLLTQIQYQEISSHTWHVSKGSFVCFLIFQRTFNHSLFLFYHVHTFFSSIPIFSPSYFQSIVSPEISHFSFFILISVADYWYPSPSTLSTPFSPHTVSRCKTEWWEGANSSCNSYFKHLPQPLKKDWLVKK